MSELNRKSSCAGRSTGAEVSSISVAPAALTPLEKVQ